MSPGKYGGWLLLFELSAPFAIIGGGLEQTEKQKFGGNKYEREKNGIINKE